MSEIAIIVRCGLCNKAFSGPREAFFVALGAHLFNPARDGRGARFFEAISRHAIQEHPEIYGAAMGLSTRFMNWKVTEMFKIDDPKIAELQDRMRWMVHQQSIRERLGDDELRKIAHEIVSEIAPSPEEEFDKIKSEAFVFHALSELRDRLEEPDRYPVPDDRKPPEERNSPIIAV